MTSTTISSQETVRPPPTVAPYYVRVYRIDSEDAWVGEVKGRTESGMAWGNTEEEMLESLADCLMTLRGVRVGRWNRLLHRLMIYRRRP